MSTRYGARARLALITGFLVCFFHSPLMGDSPAAPIAATDNFIVRAPLQESAEEILQKAERLRDEIALDWLGEKLPPGVGPTVIRVKFSDHEDKAVSWVANRADRLTHMMWLTTAQENAAGAPLAHEMTHVVLATQYPGQIPAFAMEGAASLRDGKERRSIRRRIVSWWVKTKNWPSVGGVLVTNNISPSNQTGYALSVSLTEMLLERGGKDAKSRFLQFAVSGQKSGWDAALNQFYQIRNVAELQSQWRAWVQNQHRSIALR